jgi:beta-glucuronidase
LVDHHQARALLEESKALGANFVRLAHYPHNEHMVRLADEMGLLVWSELPVYWGIAFDNPDTLANAKAQMQANMLRDFNRASIVIWSVANETKPTDDRNAFLQSVIAHVRGIDNSRLVSAALLKSKGRTANEITVDDPLREYLDVISVNEYEGWYGKRNLDQISELSWNLPDDKPLLFSEFGAGAMYGYRDDDNVRWSEDYQNKFYRETVNMIDKIPSLRGASPWILKDFKSHRRYHGRFQNFWNRKGLIAETGERKQAFYTLRDYYLKKQAEF